MSTEDRKVGLSSEFDATGIKQGVQQAKEALQELPGAARRAADGAGAPLDGIGKKSEEAARRTEAATKSLVAQIQRADTALASGGRNTAAYFETVGKQKGIDPNVLAPYIAQLRATEQAQGSATKSLDTFVDQIQRANLALQSGGKNTAAYYEALAKLEGVDTKALAPYIAQLRATEAAQEKTGMSAKATAAALRQVPAQFTDIVTALAAGQQPLTVLLQQGGQLKDTFGGIGPAAKALGGYVVGLLNPLTLAAAAIGGVAAAAYQGAQELPALNRQLILSGNAAGYTADQLTLARDAAAALSGATKGRAAEVLGEIAASAGIGATNLERFTTAALKFERAGGDAAEKTADAFKSLAKDPLQAALKLNESTNFLTRSVFEQIAALADQGRSVDAARLAQETYYAAVTQRTKSLEDNLGLLERAWRGVKDMAKGAWDTMADVGRGGVDRQLDSIRERISTAQRLQEGTGGGLIAKWGADWEQSLREQQGYLQENERLTRRAAAAEADGAKQVELANRWREEGNKFLSDAEQMQRAVAKAQEDGVRLGLEQVEINKRISLIQQQFDPQTYLDRIATAENERSESIKRGLNEVNSLRERGALNEYEAVERSAALEQRAFSSQKQALQERLAYVQQRQNSEKEASAIQSQLSAVTQAALTAEAAARRKNLDLIERGRIAMLQAYEAEAQQNRADIDSYERREYETRTKLELAQRANVEALDDELDLMKIQASMVASTEAARGRAVEYYRITLDLRKQIEEIDKAELPGGEVEREEKRAEARAIATRRMVQAQQRETIDEWTKGMDEINNSLTDALLRGFEDGKSFGRNFIDTLKNLFSTLVLRPIIQPVISAGGDFVAQLFGVGGGGGGSAIPGMSGGGSSIFSSLGSLGSTAMQLAGLKSIFGMGAQMTGFTGAGTGVALEGSASMIANGSLTQGLAQGAGALAPWALGASLGIYGGRAISGGYSVGGSGNTPVNVGTAIGAAIAGPIGAAIGGMLGGVVNRAFGRGPKEVTETGIEGTIGGGGDFSGRTYSYWKQKGGWFQSNKYGTDYGEVSSELDDMLDSSAALLLSTTAEWAKTLGLPAEALSKVTTTIKTKLTGNAEEDQKAIEAILTQYQEALASQFRDALVPFQKAGEDLTATLQRLAALQQFSDTINDLGGIFSKVARSSVDAKEGLLALVGGADQFIQLATGFASNYYSRDEIAGGKAASLQETLKGLGITADFTGSDAKAQFRALVEGTDISSAEGQKRLATLLGIQGDFADVAGYLSETGKSLSEVANQSPGLDLLAPMMASGTAQTVQATNEVRDAIVALHETIKTSSGSGSSTQGSGLVAGWREVTLAMQR